MLQAAENNLELEKIKEENNKIKANIEQIKLKNEKDKKTLKEENDKKIKELIEANNKKLDRINQFEQGGSGKIPSDGWLEVEHKTVTKLISN